MTAFLAPQPAPVPPYLYLSQYQSSFDDATGWLLAAKKRSPELRQPDCIEAFSYAGSRHHVPGSTEAGIERHLGTYRRFVNEAQLRKITIGFSQGGFVSLLGAAALKDDALADLAGLVLIAPATEPSATMRYTFERGLGRASWTQFFVEFVGGYPAVKPRIQAAYERLADLHIPVHVIDAADDSWCPLTTPSLNDEQAPYFRPMPLNTQKQAGVRPVQYHLSLAELDATLDEVCKAIGQILNKTGSPTS